MLRSGVRLRSRDQNSGFVSDSVSSDEMKLDSVGKKRASPPLKKRHHKRSKSDKQIGVIEQSSGEEPQVVAKKKKSKKSKHKEVNENDAGDARKIVRGKRRLQTREQVDVPAGSPRKRFSQRCKGNEPSQIVIDDAENSKKQSMSLAKSPCKLLKSPTKNKILNVTDENLIETSVEKYTRSTNKNSKNTKGVLERTKLINAFDEPLDSSFKMMEEEVVPNYNETYPLKSSTKHNIAKHDTNAKTKKRGTLEVDKDKLLVKEVFYNNPKRDFDRKTRSSKISAFELLNDKNTKSPWLDLTSSENTQATNCSEKPNAFDELLETSIEITEISTRSKSMKRSTFEVPSEDIENAFEPKTKKRNTREQQTVASPAKSPAKGKKRTTFEIKPLPNKNETEEEFKDRRGTFDINANGVLPKANKRGTYELDVVPVKTPEISVVTRSTRSSRRDSFKDVKKTPSLVVTKKSLNTPISSSLRKRLNVPLVKGSNKIKISDSKTSLSESDVSSPSMLLRRAQKLNPPSAKPSTPKLTLPKVSSPKKKTPQRSTSKVKKVPNYAAIHQDAYDRMESLDAHVQRKADRAKALLSGQKVTTAGKHTPFMQDAKTKKQLFSTTLAAKNIQIKPNFKFTNKTTNSPMTFGLSTAKRHIGAGDASRLVDTPRRQSPIKKTVGFDVITPVNKRLQPVRHVKTPMPSKEEIWKVYGSKIPVATISSGPIVPVVAGIPLRKNPARLKDVASVSTKSKASTTTVDSRRNHIKGVRSNRRFDLLMSMRK